MHEIVDALEREMPRAGLRAWFAQLQAFCLKHGGERYYREVMELIAECDARVARSRAAGEPGPENR